MLRSMTGFGSAAAEGGGWRAECEVRSVNNRGLKVSSRVVPSDRELETEVDRLVRERLRRGSVQLSLTLERTDAAAVAGFDQDRVAAYWAAYREAASRAGLPKPTSLEPVLSLPGVLGSTEEAAVDDAARTVAAEALSEAVDHLNEFRDRDGLAMRDDLSKLSGQIRGELSAVAERAPEVVREYRDRFRERLTELLAEVKAKAPEEAIVREAGVFAERADINEEVTRLTGHLDQFEARIAAEEVEGRKLDFLGQEMFREINTIGSKANDLTIARRVVEMKAAAEKIREMVQNVE